MKPFFFLLAVCMFFYPGVNWASQSELNPDDPSFRSAAKRRQDGSFVNTDYAVKVVHPDTPRPNNPAKKPD